MIGTEPLGRTSAEDVLEPARQVVRAPAELADVRDGQDAVGRQERRSQVTDGGDALLHVRRDELPGDGDQVSPLGLGQVREEVPHGRLVARRRGRPQRLSRGHRRAASWTASTCLHGPAIAAMAAVPRAGAASSRRQSTARGIRRRLRPRPMRRSPTLRGLDPDGPLLDQPPRGSKSWLEPFRATQVEGQLAPKEACLREVVADDAREGQRRQGRRDLLRASGRSWPRAPSTPNRGSQPSAPRTAAMPAPGAASGQAMERTTLA